MSAADRNSATAAINAADVTQDDLARKYGLEELFADTESQLSSASGPSEVGQALSEDAAGVVTVFNGTGTSGTLSIAAWSTAGDQFSSRWPVALLVVSIMTALFWILGRPEFADVVASRPQRLAIAVGIAWWFWLEPSIIGLAIVAISLAAPVWRRRRRQGRRHEPSSHERLSRGRPSVSTCIAAAPTNYSYGQLGARFS
jgi:hypothetical protein